jgi:hypothetical protein
MVQRLGQIAPLGILPQRGGIIGQKLGKNCTTNTISQKPLLAIVADYGGRAALGQLPEI